MISSSLLLSFEPLSNGYKDIKLGMTQAQVKEILKKSVEFEQNKEEVLITRLDPDTDIISVEGIGFIKYAYFHFDHDSLYQIFLKIDESRIGYYFLLKKLSDKFGVPTKFSPEKTSWINQTVDITLEKPCNLKYLYLPVWNNIVKNDNTSDKTINTLRENFANGL